MFVYQLTIVEVTLHLSAKDIVKQVDYGDCNDNYLQSVFTVL